MIEPDQQSIRISNASIRKLHSKHRLQWQKLLRLLICEFNRPSSGIKNIIAVEVAYYIILCMMQIDPKTHQSSILLLPHILFEMNLLDSCYEFLKGIELKNALPKDCFRRVISSFTQGRSEHHSCISEPIQLLFCNEKCDPFLILNLIYLKLQYKNRLNELKTLWQICETMTAMYAKGNDMDLTLTITNKVSTYLGVSKNWKRMNALVLERQASELVKLIMRINSFLLRKFIMSVERPTNDNNIFNTMPLSIRLSIKKWRSDVNSLNYIKLVMIDCRNIV